MYADNQTAEIKLALRAFDKGEIVLFPTDTIWGIGCISNNIEAYNRLYEIKRRPTNKQVLILVADFTMLTRYAEVNDKQKAVIEEYIEPTTFVLEAKEGCPNHLISATEEVAVRIVKDVFCKQIIELLDEALLSTSPNVSGEETPLKYENIPKDIVDAVGHVVNAKYFETKGLRSSQIIRIKNDGVEILRS